MVKTTYHKGNLFYLENGSQIKKKTLMEQQVFITCGCGSRFDRSKFNPIKNRRFCKPSGGLWASLEGSSAWSWMDWCESEEFHVSLYKSSQFRFRLKEGSRVYVISSVVDVMTAPLQERTPRDWSYYINFEKLAEEYDAVLLTAAGEAATRWSDPYSLYGWDVESLLVLNPDCVEEIMVP